MNTELKITLRKHEIEKMIKIINNQVEETVDFELGFESSVLLSSISKGIEEHIKNNKLQDIHVGLIIADKYRVASYSECVKMHLDIFEESYLHTLSNILQQYYEGDYGDMYDSFLGKSGNYEGDKVKETLKGLYDTLYGKIYISMNELKQISICHNFERQFRTVNTMFYL